MMLFCSCNITRVQTEYWQTAHFIDNKTLAVIGWNYKQKLPNDAWDATEYYEIRQIYIQYDLEQRRKVHEVTLVDGTVFFTREKEVFYSNPYLFINSHRNTNSVLIYDVKTNQIVTEVTSSNPVLLAGFSATGDVVIVEELGIRRAILVETGKTLLKDSSFFPFYLSENGVYLGHCKRYAGDDKPVLCRYDSTSQLMDTIVNDRIVSVRGVTNNPSSVIVRSDPLEANTSQRAVLGHVAISGLISGHFDLIEFPAGISGDDFALTESLFVDSDEGSIEFGSFNAAGLVNSEILFAVKKKEL